MERRDFLRWIGLGALGAATGGALVGAPAEALAGGARKKVREIQGGDLGTTLLCELDAAPFPCPGAPYEDPTVLVFVPAHYRAPADGAVDLVVHFHGHNSTTEAAVKAHAIREQLAESKQNVVLVAPQGPVNAADGAGGKLDRPGGLARLAAEVAGVLASPAARDALGAAAPPKKAKLRAGRVALSSHSGGYRVAASCLRHGGVEVSEVYLFDSLYGETDAYRDWVLAGRGKRRRKLVSHYVGGKVREKNLELLAELERRGVRCDHETRPGQLSRAELAKGRAIFLASALAHTSITHELNALRDCLFASGFKRNLETDWFDKKDEPRPLEARTPAGEPPS
jgi:hypothetical protein